MNKVLLRPAGKSKGSLIPSRPEFVVRTETTPFGDQVCMIVWERPDGSKVVADSLINPEGNWLVGKALEVWGRDAIAKLGV